MDKTPEEYRKYVKKRQEKSPVVKDVVLAFGVGGSICVLGEALGKLWRNAGLSQADAALAVSVSLIALSVLLTALGLYHRLARWGGAGTLVPITGFANAVAAPAIDFRAEGLVTGMAARMFQVAGPVLVFGTCASVVYGVVLWIVGG